MAGSRRSQGVSGVQSACATRHVVYRALPCAAGTRMAHPGGPGQVVHFCAVATYGIQHPGLMGYTQETVDGMAGGRHKLDGGVMDYIRRSVRERTSSPGRVTRRGDVPVPAEGVQRWP